MGYTQNLFGIILLYIRISKCLNSTAKPCHAMEFFLIATYIAVRFLRDVKLTNACFIMRYGNVFFTYQQDHIKGWVQGALGPHQ